MAWNEAYVTVRVNYQDTALRVQIGDILPPDRSVGINYAAVETFVAYWPDDVERLGRELTFSEYDSISEADTDHIFETLDLLVDDWYNEGLYHDMPEPKEDPYYYEGWQDDMASKED